MTAKLTRRLGQIPVTCTRRNTQSVNSESITVSCPQGKPLCSLPRKPDGTDEQAKGCASEGGFPLACAPAVLAVTCMMSLLALSIIQGTLHRLRQQWQCTLTGQCMHNETEITHNHTQAHTLHTIHRHRHNHAQTHTIQSISTSSCARSLISLLRQTSKYRAAQVRGSIPKSFSPSPARPHASGHVRNVPLRKCQFRPVAPTQAHLVTRGNICRVNTLFSLSHVAAEADNVGALPLNCEPWCYRCTGLK